VKLFATSHNSKVQCIDVFKVPGSLKEVVPIKAKPIAVPCMIETPLQSIVHAIIPSFII
jgi:hypothetical protein